MKKLTMCLCTGLVMLSLASCGNGDGGQGSSDTQGSGSGVEDGSGTPDNSDAQGSGGGVGQPETEGGWSEEMAGLRGAVVEALGENYWPDMQMDAEMLQAVCGISPDMYEDFMAEMPMISNNVDMLVIIKAKEDKAAAVEEALNTYRNARISDTLQYPMNISKIQASRVEKIGSYVLFVQLGGDTMNAMDVSEEAALIQCQEANKQAVDAVSQKLGK